MQVENLLRGHDQPYIAGDESVSVADLALYHEIVQVLSVLAVTDVLFTIDTSTNPILVVKNVDISAFPKINAWMHRMQKEDGITKAMFKFEDEMKELRKRLIKGE